MLANIAVINKCEHIFLYFFLISFLLNFQIFRKLSGNFAVETFQVSGNFPGNFRKLPGSFQPYIQYQAMITSFKSIKHKYIASCFVSYLINLDFHLHSFVSTYLLPLILLIIPSSHSSSKLVRSWWFFSWLVLLVSLILLSGSPNQWFHLCILYLLFPAVYPKVPYLAHFFHSQYNSWFRDLKKSLKYNLDVVPGTDAIRRRRLLLRSQTVKTVKLTVSNC